MSQAKTITPDELERLHRRLGRTRNALRNQTMLHLMHWAGMRVGEVAALRIKDLINRDGTLKTEIHLGAAQTKGNQSAPWCYPRSSKMRCLGTQPPFGQPTWNGHCLCPPEPPRDLPPTAWVTWSKAFTWAPGLTTAAPTAVGGPSSPPWRKKGSAPGCCSP